MNKKPSGGMPIETRMKQEYLPFYNMGKKKRGILRNRTLGTTEQEQGATPSQNEAEQNQDGQEQGATSTDESQQEQHVPERTNDEDRNFRGRQEQEQNNPDEADEAHRPTRIMPISLKINREKTPNRTEKEYRKKVRQQK